MISAIKFIFFIICFHPHLSIFDPFIRLCHSKYSSLAWIQSTSGNSLTGSGYLSYTNKLQIQRHFVIFILCDFQIWGTERSRKGKFGKIRGCDRKVLLILSASKYSFTICALWAGALSCRSRRYFIPALGMTTFEFQNWVSSVFFVTTFP